MLTSLSRIPVAETTTNKEAALLAARIDDAVRRCRNNYHPEFLGFLDSGEQASAGERLKYSGISHGFWGGYPEAERVFLWISAGDEPTPDSYPFCCIEAVWRQGDSLSHRDFLGTLMALRIKRESIGDICVEAGHGLVFLTQHAAKLTMDEITKIGRVGVTIRQIPMDGISFTRTFLPVSGTVSSLRLDCIVAFLGNISRGKASQIILSGLVSLNGAAVTACDRQIQTDDKISIRGVGKFIYETQDGLSRKDKLRLKFKKYQ